MDIHSFSIYEEYFDLINILKPKKRERVLYAVVEYMFKGIEPDLGKEEKAIFESLRRALDKQKNKSRKQRKSETKTKSNENQNETKTTTQQDVNVNVNVNINNIIKFIEDNFSRTISSYEYEQIVGLVKLHSNEVVLYAFQKTLEANKQSLNYTKGILSNWKNDNLNTLEEIKQQESKKMQVNSKKTIVPKWIDSEVSNEKIDEEVSKNYKEFNEFLEDLRSEGT